MEFTSGTLASTTPSTAVAINPFGTAVSSRGQNHAKFRVGGPQTRITICPKRVDFTTEWLILHTLTNSIRIHHHPRRKFPKKFPRRSALGVQASHDILCPRKIARENSQAVGVIGFGFLSTFSFRKKKIPRIENSQAVRRDQRSPGIYRVLVFVCVQHNAHQ